MATQVKHRRGTNAEILAGTPAIGELWFNTTDNSIHMGDGATQGGIKHVNVNMSDLVFGNVVDMITAFETFKEGFILKTAGRNVKGDGGGASYLVVADGTYSDGSDGHHEGFDYFQVTGFQIALFHSGFVYPEQFGWVGDWDGTTGTDNIDAINNMISYCAPLEYQGSVAATKGVVGNVRAKIVGGFGVARVTDSVVINPFIQWEGLKKGAFFGGNGGTTIVGDFDSNTKYVADTAPMMTGGVRPLGASYGRNDWDGGGSVGCYGWKIDSVNFDAAQGRTLKGAFNRQIAQQSVLTNCSLGANGGGVCYEGLRNQVCWGGNVSDNHIIGTAYSIRNDRDVTTDYQHNNYCTVTGTPPNSVDYSYVSWPNSDLQDKTACIINTYSDPHLDSNTYEGAQIGVMATNGTQLKDSNGYFEKISEYIYAANTVNIAATPKWIICPAARLVSLRGSSTTKAVIDLTATSYFDVTDFGVIESFVKGLEVLGSEKAIKLGYNSRVDLTDLSFKNVLDIYVDNTGDDGNSGYSSSNAVLTIQAAIDRCKQGVKNVIHLTDGQTIATKYQYISGNATSVTFSNLQIEFIGSATIAVGNSSNQTHCIPLSSSDITFNGPSIDMSAAATVDNYKSFIRSKNGNVNLTIEGGSVTGTGGTLIGVQYGSTGSANVSMRSVTLGLGFVFTTNGGTNKAFSWSENSWGVTDNGAIEGNADEGKIFSTLFI